VCVTHALGVGVARWRISGNVAGVPVSVGEATISSRVSSTYTSLLRRGPCGHSARDQINPVATPASDIASTWKRRHWSNASPSGDQITSELHGAMPPHRSMPTWRCIRAGASEALLPWQADAFARIHVCSPRISTGCRAGCSPPLDISSSQSQNGVGSSEAVSRPAGWDATPKASKPAIRGYSRKSVNSKNT